MYSCNLDAAEVVAYLPESAKSLKPKLREGKTDPLVFIETGCSGQLWSEGVGWVGLGSSLLQDKFLP